MKLHLRNISRYWPLVLASILMVNSPAFAADDAQKPEVLNNASIIELQGLKLGDGVILQKIKTSKCDFDVSVAGLKQLKTAQVSDAVIQAMLGAKTSSAAPVATATTAPAAANAVAALPTGDLNDPKVQHDPGVWMYEETGGVKKMTQLNAESYRIWAGMNGPWGSAERAVLSSLSAKTQTSSHRPVFYMYFGEGSQNNFGMMGTTTPDQVPLAILDLKPKTQERLLVIGSGAAYGGYNSGIRTKSLRTFSSEKIAAGVYKITIDEDLKTGEYAFCYYPAQVQIGTAGRMFCFGIH